MRSFFPLVVLVLAAIIPACTCSSREESPAATPAPETSTAPLARQVSSIHLQPNLRIPAGRLHLNPAGVRPLRSAPGAVPSGAAPAPASASATSSAR